MPGKKNNEYDLNKAPIENLFDAIAEVDLNKVKLSIRRGANVKIKIDGKYPIQSAMLVNASMERIDPKKIYSKQILDLIEEKSKAAGILNDKGEIVNKGGDRSNVQENNNDEEEWVLVDKDPESVEGAKIPEPVKEDDERSLSEIRRRLEKNNVARKKESDTKGPTINKKKGGKGKTPSL